MFKGLADISKNNEIEQKRGAWLSPAREAVCGEVI